MQCGANANIRQGRSKGVCWKDSDHLRLDRDQLARETALSASRQRHGLRDSSNLHRDVDALKLGYRQCNGRTPPKPQNSKTELILHLKCTLGTCTIHPSNCAVTGKK